MQQGQGGSTQGKEIAFAALMRMALGIGKAAPDYPHWHLEMNAGSGRNDKASCDGSPLIFLRAAEEAGRTYRAFFCDNDEANIAALRANCFSLGPPPDGCERTVTCKDNAEFLDGVATLIRAAENPRFALGTCLCDPNGWKGFPVEAIERFAALFPRIDLILNLNLSFFAMVKGAAAHPAPSCRPFADAEKWPSPEVLVGRFHKRHWLIRNPSSAKGMRFSVLYGSNFKVKTARFMGFVPLESIAGQEIIRHLKSIHPEQRELFS